MKKVFLVLMTILCLATQTYARSGWATALVDAGGAWGGATSGAPYFPPYGAIVGGVLCGAAASLAICCGGGPQNYPITNNIVTNPNNRFEEIGVKHNLLVSQYIERGLERTDMNTIVSNLFNLAKENNIDTKDFSVDFISNETTSYLKNDLTTIDGVFKMMSKSLPTSIHNTLKNSLTRIDATKNIEDFNKVIIEEENKITSVKELNETQKKAFNAFFSTFRHSANFWGRE